MSDKQWRWVARGAVLWYCLLAIFLIEAKPGFQYDEAIDVLAAVHLRHSNAEIKLPHPAGTWVCLKGHCFPLMSAEYIGSIKDYLCLPLFAIFGPSAALVRLVTTALGALGIFGIATFLGRQLNYPLAAAAAWAMAIHPSYLDVTVLDNPGFSPCMGALGLVSLAASAYLENRSALAAFWLGATMGLAVWARANDLWLLAALFVALAICAGRRLLAPISQWASLAVGGVVGALPFLAYQGVSHGGTWAAAGTFPVSESLGQRLPHRLTMLAETLLSDGEHRVIWGGAGLPQWQLWLFPALVAASCLICVAFRQRSGFMPRVLALTLLILTGVFLFSRLPVAEHHMVILVPLAIVVVVLAGWKLLPRYRWAGAVFVTVAVVYAASALYWQFATLAGLRRTGGTGVWSDAIFTLTERLRADFPGREVKVLDWGLQNSVYVLSDGRVRTREIFWDATVEKTEWNGPWLEEIRHGGVFLLNGPENRQIPAASTGFLRALAEGQPSTRRFTIPQRSGAVFAEVIDIQPNSLGAGARVQEIPPEESTGFYAIEPGGWRWTKGEFSLAFPASSHAISLTMHVNVPEPCIQKSGAITMSVRMGEHVLPAETFLRAGDYAVTRSLQADWMTKKVNRFDFRLDKTLPPTPADGRELGIVFVRAWLSGTN